MTLAPIVPSQPAKAFGKWMSADRPSAPTSILSTFSQPSVEMPDCFLSVTALHVYFRSLRVSGSPSDHLRFARSLTWTVKPSPLLSLVTLPLNVIGPSESHGIQCPSADTVSRVGIVAAMTWVLANAFEK